MKTIFSVAALSLGLMAAMPSFAADKVVITGEPVMLQESGDVYRLPDTYTMTSTPYHYVTIGGQKRVCYADKQPQLASLDMQTISVDMKGQKVQWNCYTWDDQYFMVNP